jgi:hypothetical protein
MDVNLGLGQTKVTQYPFGLNALEFTEETLLSHRLRHDPRIAFDRSCIAYQNAQGRL